MLRLGLGEEPVHSGSLPVEHHDAESSSLHYVSRARHVRVVLLLALVFELLLRQPLHQYLHID